MEQTIRYIVFDIYFFSAAAQDMSDCIVKVDSSGPDINGSTDLVIDGDTETLYTWGHVGIQMEKV